jgi:predicted N-formylglutamate amidohydrolase
MNHDLSSSLLGKTDPAPVEVLYGDKLSDLVLVCEHAGRAVPEKLGYLGVSEEILRSHRGWDIGAETVARQIADLLGAPLVIQRYSRLVIDCNRPPFSPQSIPYVSDHADIPGNIAACPSEKADRIKAIFDPMNAAIKRLFETSRRAAFSIHSFTTEMDGKSRPWHAGFLTRASLDTAETLIMAIQKRQPQLTLAINEPYAIDSETDWFIPHYAEALGLSHCLIEIRNDQIDHPEGAKFWAELLAEAITDLMETLS